MSHPGSAPCPPALAAGEGGPPSVVVVRILSVRPNTDLEGDDDYVPYYDNHADIYGTVTIDGEKFSLPRIDDNDHPHWETLGPKSGVFEKEVTSGTVPISIDIWEGDSEQPSRMITSISIRHPASTVSTSTSIFAP